MRICYILFILLFGATYGNCQQYIIASPKLNIAYVGIENPLDVIVNGRPCKTFTLTTDNGKIEAANDSCSYLLIPKHTGITTIKILTLPSNGSKEIGTVKFRTRYVPDPVACIGGITGGEVSKNTFKTGVGVSCMLKDFDYDVNIRVRSFTVSILRKDKAIFVQSSNKPVFDNNVKASFESLETGDRVLISNIVCRYPDSSERTLQPIEFKITD